MRILICYDWLDSAGGAERVLRELLRCFPHAKIATQIYQDVIFNGKVSLIGVVGDAAHNYQVEISVPNNAKNHLKAGMYGTVVDENIVRNNSLSVPRQAIFGSAKDPQVYIVENGKASLKKLKMNMVIPGVVFQNN